VLIHLLTTPNTGDQWADARACGLPANAIGNDATGAVSMKHRPQATVFGGSYGPGVSTVTTKRLLGLGGSTG
jgi:hypothetical protein